MKKLSREYLPCLLKSAIIFFVVLSITLPLGIMVGSSNASPTVAESTNGGILKRKLENQKEVVTLKLLGVTSYELTELFHNLLKTTPGIIEARRYRLNLDPKYPQACCVEWQITFAETTPFMLESEIYNRLKEITNNEPAVCVVNGFEVTLNASELTALKTIKPWQATSHSLRFIQTQNFAENRKSSWPHQPDHYQRWSDCPNHGFE
ncbi:MAG: hypothetical protein J7M09_04250 [Deltaproteobacteria bacterium]|nr:hypothetical protein [Candidatus Tharpella sp.]